MPNFPYGVTVTVVSRTLTGKDDYGNDVYEDATFDVPFCSVQPGGTNETTQFTDQLSSEIVAYLPYGTDVEFLSALIVNGITYEVQGKPNVWESPFSGNTAPVEVRATKVSGVSV